MALDRPPGGIWDLGGRLVSASLTRVEGLLNPADAFRVVCHAGPDLVLPGYNRRHAPFRRATRAYLASAITFLIRVSFSGGVLLIFAVSIAFLIYILIGVRRHDTVKLLYSGEREMPSQWQRKPFDVEDALINPQSATSSTCGGQ